METAKEFIVNIIEWDKPYSERVTHAVWRLCKGFLGREGNVALSQARDDQDPAWGFSLGLWNVLELEVMVAQP